VISNREYQHKLLREVVSRANQEELQQYEEIVKRQIEISKRVQQISFEKKVLNERNRMNVFPEQPNTNRAPDKTHEEVKRMSDAEHHMWIEQIIEENAEYNAKSKGYIEKLEGWSAKNNVIMDERMKLTEEFLELKKESDILEEKEKWLLLSIAIRSQPNLLNYIQG
jgi:hypothetical protein